MAHPQFSQRRRHVRTPLSHATTDDQQVAPYVSTAYTRQRRKTARSAELLEAVRSLDVTVDESGRRELMAVISKEYDERQGGSLLGLMGKCYLGHPFVDHRMAVNGGILEHFTREDSVPPPFDQTRALARSSAYAYIEIYSDGQIVPVRPDGTAVL